MSVSHDTISLYAHIPFCERKCIYCDFYSIEDLSPQKNFVEILLREIDLKITAYPELSGKKLRTIFFGGGTPSLLSPEELRRVTTKIEEHFRILPDAEFTLECNPGTITREKLEGYRRLGVNRLSFGVQSFHRDELEFLGRIHSSDEAREAIRLARQAGFENINLDLIFALPNQTHEKLSYSLDEALKLGTEHISAYNLIVEEGTPLNRMVKLGQVGEMNTDEAAELMMLTQERLTSEGYDQYEISNYSRGADHRCEHNLVYWDGYADYVSFGPSAHEFLNGERSWNVSSLDRYDEMIASGSLPRINSERVSSNERRTEVLYCQLRSTGIRVRDFNEQFREDVTAHPEMSGLLAEGFVETDNDMIRLTPKGYRCCDAIVVRLMNHQTVAE